MKRDFIIWLGNLKDNIASWDYYTNFDKAYNNINNIKIELNILNSLVGSNNIENDFKLLVNKYPEIIKVVPILLAKREKEIKINTADKSYIFNFNNLDCSIDQYILFMRNSGLFNLIQNHIINNLVDYVLGIEVGMDTNSRKNRIGHVMEDIVESYLINAKLIKNKTYFKEMYISEVERKFNLDLKALSNNSKVEKRFDFVFIGAMNEIYLCECNFYTGQGSKLNETARSYKLIAQEVKNIKNVSFVWITDGLGWLRAKQNLKETFDILDTLYNLSDLENGSLEELIDEKKFIKANLLS